jgi:acyl-CoA synthetase (AMP-forming)/AMP-acid ligase II
MFQALARHAAQKPDAPAFIDAASTAQLSWRGLHDRVVAISVELRSKVPEASVVLIQLPNSCEFPAAFLGVLAAGCTAFPISRDTPASQVKAIQEISGASALIDSSGLTPFTSARRRIMPATLLLLSSGSTGNPKIVCRSLASLRAVSDQMCQSIGIVAADRVLATVPLCHSYGLEHGLLAPLWVGATVHLSRGLDLSLLQRQLRESCITVLPAVPSIFEMLANLSLTTDRYPHLRTAYSAGAPLPVTVANRFHDRCGIRIGQIFGATEIGSVTYSNPSNTNFNPQSVGQPMQGVKIKIVDEHLWVSAGSMFSSYLDEVSQIEDGFYPTGDLARLDDDANLIITGREKLLINIGGLKVNPLEVEQVLMQHPSVRDCVVVPVQQSETVVRLKAIITQHDPAQSLPIDALRQFARDRLAGYKVPRLFEVRDELPRTQSGKILRSMVQA